MFNRNRSRSKRDKPITSGNLTSLFAIFIVNPIPTTSLNNIRYHLHLSCYVKITTHHLLYIVQQDRMFQKEA